MQASDPGSSFANGSQAPTVINGVMTPPRTPIKVEDVMKKRASLSADSARLVANPTAELTSMLSVGVGLGVGATQFVEHMLEKGMDVGPMHRLPEFPKPYQESYRIHAPPEQLGYGAWSKVFGASPVPLKTLRTDVMPMTPPESPESSRRTSATQVLAVKVLARRDGKSVIEKEARILTYLHSHSSASKYVVPFLGFDASQTAIVMASIPLTLEQLTTEARKLIGTSVKNSHPVLGKQAWAELASGLISGLAFLHRKKTIHGDIKPANILLLPADGVSRREGLQPLYCDFSSSRVFDESAQGHDDEEVSAVTTEYASPELLRALKPRRQNGPKERAVVTYASDVFALGVTLIFAAIGDSPLSLATSSIQKTAMAEQGLPLQFAQSGAQASRVYPGGMVDQLVRRAVAKNVAERMTVSELVLLAEKVLDGSVRNE